MVADSEGTTSTDFTYVGLALMSLSGTWSDGGSPESTESWKLSYLYDEYGRPYAGIYRDTTTTPAPAPVFFGILTTDRGDVVALLDENGAPFAAYRYDACGNPLGQGNVATGVWAQETLDSAQATVISEALAADIAQRQMLRYAGYCYDQESGMYYLSARHYDPMTRQFLSKDLSRNDGEQSAYQYCLGNPVGNVDPNGLSWLDFSKNVRTRIVAALNAVNKFFHRATVSVGGSEWKYTPKLWDKNTWNGNCYLYAVLKMTVPTRADGAPNMASMQPGALARTAQGDDAPQELQLNENSIIGAARADLGTIGGTITKCEAGTVPAEGYRKVALVISPGVDYHWFEQNTNGLFSGKSGCGWPVSNRDGLGAIITDPGSDNCNRRFEFSVEGRRRPRSLTTATFAATTW